jgi:glycerophosphoryl diester phosphodiesterase
MKLQAEKPFIIAHRGASAFAPENTLAAFRRAIADGAEGVEFDVRLAKDGVPVVFHDATLSRVSSKQGLLSHYTSEELQKTDVGSWFNRRKPEKANESFSTETISTLQQVLDFLREYKGLIYIELKCRAGEIEQITKIVCRIIGDSLLLPQIIVKSFQLEALPFVRRFCPEVQTAALFEPKLATVLRRKNDYTKTAHDFGADQISVHFSLATKKLMGKAEKQNIPVTIWTADNPLWLQRAIERKITAIITNNPARLLAKKAKIFGRI